MARTFVRQVDGLVIVEVGGQVIEATTEHPFWVVGSGWIVAKDLQIGYMLQTLDGGYLPVDDVCLRPGPVTVYNFEVADAHDYFVSDIEVLVHNACSEEALLNRAANRAKGIPDSALGPSGEPKIIRVKNMTRKEAIDAAQDVSGKGQQIMKHKGHTHGVRKGGKVRTHFEH